MKKFVISLVAVIVAGASLGYVATQTRIGQDLVLNRLIAAALGSQTTPEPFDGLKVFMCGTASPLPAPGRAQACVAIIAGAAIYVVDAGAGSVNNTMLARLPLERLKAVLLTHYHSDHIASLADFNLNSWVAGRSAPLLVIGPEGVDRVVAGFNSAYQLDRDYRVAHHGEDLLPPELYEM